MRRKLTLFVGVVFLSVVWNAALFAAPGPSDELMQMVIKLIGDSDREFRAAGLEQVRTSLRGESATKRLASELPKLDSQAQIGLLSALADRGDPAAHSAILELFATHQDERVKVAAIAAIGQLGSAADLPILVKTLSSESSAERASAKQSLIKLSGLTINKAITTESRTATVDVKATLFDVLAVRRASDELPTLVAALGDENAQVRGGAMSALSQIGRPEQIPAMLRGILKAPKGGDRDNAERQVAMVCSRIDNSDQRGTTLIEAINSVPVSDRDELLSLAGRVGGNQLINFVADIALGQEVARRQLGIDALSKWPNASVADKLLEIAEKATDPVERKLAFQGYIKVSASRDNRSDKQRLDRMKQAMKVAKTPEEQTLVINRSRTAYDVESVRFVLPYLDQSQFTEITCETIVEIAHHREVRDPNKAEFDKVLDRVIEVTKDPVVVDRAQRYKRGETWERPKK